MTIGIIGCGHMGAAIATRLAGHNRVCLYDRNVFKTDEISKKAKVIVCQTFEDLLQRSKYIILAIKPQNLEELAMHLKPLVLDHHVIISILGGVTLATLSSLFPNNPIIKMMPNIPIMIGEGAISICFNDRVALEEKKVILELFKHLGKTFEIQEIKMNGMTSLAGCGPAFVFMMVEAMIDAGVYMGLNAQEAKEAAIQMMQGSLEMIHQSKMGLSELKWLVTSPMGSTICGVKSLEESALRGTIMKGFIAAYEKNKGPDH
jgi:pyrroline-5-carboxylate reductase